MYEMAARFFNWEHRPAVILDTPGGGVEGLFVPTGSDFWSRASSVEILESGHEMSQSALLEMFPSMPPLEGAGIVGRLGMGHQDQDVTKADTVGHVTENNREDQKRLLLARGFSNALAESWLDRSGYPRPPGWYSVFFYPGSMRLRNTAIFWAVVLTVAVWFFFF